MYDTPEEANQKLSNCVVMFEKEPVYIYEAFGSKDNVSISFLPLSLVTQDEDMRDHMLNKSIKDKGWNFRNLGPKLGYVNYNGSPLQEAVFCCRYGIRKSQSTQGLSKYNVKILSEDRKFGSISFSSLITTPEFSDTLKGKFPSFKETLGIIEINKEKIFSIAFDRKFALRIDPIGPYYLQYKKTDIGFSVDLNTFKLASQYEYLSETLESFSEIKIA